MRFGGCLGPSSGSGQHADFWRGENFGQQHRWLWLHRQSSCQRRRSCHRAGAGARRRRFGTCRCCCIAGRRRGSDGSESHAGTRRAARHTTCPASASSSGTSREAALADHALVVNATPLGMVGHEPLDLDLSRASASLVVADNVYVPLETPLLAQRGLGACGRWKVSACCCIRPFRAFAPGLASSQRSTTNCATSWPRTCRRDEGSWPDRRHWHGQIDSGRCVPPCANSGVRCGRCGASDAGTGWPRGARDRGGISGNSTGWRSRSRRTASGGAGQAGRAEASRGYPASRWCSRKSARSSRGPGAVGTARLCSISRCCLKPAAIGVWTR